MVQAKRIYEPKKPEEQIDLQKIIANAFSSTLAQVEKWTKWLSLEIEKENNVVEKVMARISTEISKLKLDKAIVTQDIYNQLIKGVETATQEFFTLLNNHEHLEYLTQADKDECINSASEQINEAVVNFTNAFKPLSEQLDSKCDKEHTHDEYLTEADVEEMESELEEKIEAKAEKNHKHKIWDVEWLSEKIDGKAEKEHKHDEYATRQELEFIAMQKARWAGWGWHVIQTSGVVLAQRSNMNFIGATVTDDPDNNATVVTITWGSWSWDVVWPASATDGNIALYDWTTGKLIKNSTYSPASFAAALTADENYVTDAQLGVIQNTSWTNTGDNATNSQYASDYRAANFVDWTDYLAPTGNGSALTWLTKSQVWLGNVDNTSDATKDAATATLTNKTLTSPVLTTPVLWTPSSGNLSSCTADWTDEVGFRNIPANSQSAAYTTVIGDKGKSIDHPSADANARTFTIAANASVAYPVGTTISFSNMTSQVVTIAINSDTMYLAWTGTTGSRSLAQYGVATARKLTSTTWIISGIWLT